jgi:hypothetical protein
MLGMGNRIPTRAGHAASEPEKALAESARRLDFQLEDLTAVLNNKEDYLLTPQGWIKFNQTIVYVLDELTRIAAALQTIAGRSILTPDRLTKLEYLSNRIFRADFGPRK